jgi:hypothetical protein
MNNPVSAINGKNNICLPMEIFWSDKLFILTQIFQRSNLLPSNGSSNTMSIALKFAENMTEQPIAFFC